MRYFPRLITESPEVLAALTFMAALCSAPAAHATAWGDLVTINGDPAAGRICSGDTGGSAISCATPAPYVDGNGNLGIATASPQATLDVNGYLRLAKNTTAPATCSGVNDGAIALSSKHTLCICKGASSSWVEAWDGATSCTW